MIWGWIVAIIIGGIAGWIAEKVMRSDMGLGMNIILGIVGALILNAILAALGLFPDEGEITWLWQLIAGVIGACILIALFRMFRGRPAR
jgi:uncharacterized membrane protein YeaQ/YmgE (transglycosylase-associated protein family)